MAVGVYRWAITGCTWGLQVGLGIFRWDLAFSGGTWHLQVELGGYRWNLAFIGGLDVYGGTWCSWWDLAFMVGLGVYGETRHLQVGNYRMHLEFSGGTGH